MTSAESAGSGMSSKEEEPRIKINWRMIGGEPSAAWRRLLQKLVAGGKDKLADSHPERGTTAQDASQGKEQ